ncbi:FG-GAP-like repeat-containing protein [Amycolatopsis sp. NPDC088138]|uniref:FG-GAP-like repeat-containing protein n=1 Tax=Amycolatopsis sp. NPDC088138 TaxID=3363938 RepID=UPI003829EEB3
MRRTTGLRFAAASAVVLAATAAGAAPASAVSASTPTDSYGFAAKLTADGRACSGALVAPSWVVTAASCFPETPQGGVPAKATGALVGRPGRTAKVTNVVVRGDRGVALARLDTAFTDVPAVALPATSLVVGEKLRLIGYGRTSDEWVPDQPHTATFTTTSATTTASLALTGDNGADACKGDAGGPVVREIGGVTELFGVAGTSWQHGCFAETETRQGTTAPRVDDLNAWIRGQVLAPTAKGGNHSVTVSWSPLRAEDHASYTVYGGTTAQVPIDAAHLLGGTSATSYVHTSVPSKQTWYYRVVARPSGGSSSEPSDTVSATTTARSVSDFTGDGKDDIATFTRGTAGDVFAAGSDGTKFVGTTAQWGSNLGAGTEVPLSGDFNGDGKVDAVVFKRGTSGDVVVALSDGTKFGPATLWHDFFGINDEIPAVGDFNGDGKDDIAAFKRGSTADVIVSLSDGTKFGTATLWHDHFGIGSELPYVGDFNGDGKDDIAVFTRGTAGDVFVALSDGTKFAGDGVKWHDNFAFNDEVPAIGDFNGDGKADIATFTRGTASDVFVALSDGTKFVGTTVKWHDHFTIDGEVPGVGDFDGDGKADIVTFTRGSAADVFVSPSDGTKFVGNSVKWHDNFAYNSEVPVPRAIELL